MHTRQELRRTLDSVFHQKTGPRIHQISLQLKTYGALWPQQSMLIQSHKH